MVEFAAAGVFIKFKERFLFIKRGADVKYPTVWALPGGMIDPGETPIAAVVRETAEEVGININTHKILALGAVPIKFPDQEVNFHLFLVELSEEPQLSFQREEIGAAEFLTFEEVLARPFINGLDECIQLCWRHL